MAEASILQPQDGTENLGAFECDIELALINPPRPSNSCPKSIIELFPSSKQLSVPSGLGGLETGEPWGFL